jgi:hypothetical protein
MKVRYILPGILSVGAAGALTFGCSGEKANPKTAGKADLNPPGLLDTVTRDSKIELRWTAGNVEDDFKGYYVFAMKKSDYDVKAKGQAKFPAKADPEKAGIPRCLNNTKWFEAFGLPATDAECEADKATSASGTALTGDDAGLTADTTASSGEKVEKLTGFVLCDETKTAKEPSLIVTPPAITTQKCTVSKLADGTALANGTTYVFFAVAVADDDLKKVSWTSNVVSDTPSKDSASESSVTLDNNQSWAITVDAANGTATLATAATTCVAGACGTLSGPNTASVSTPSIFLSRPDLSTFKQRLYISSPQSGDVKLQPRGPQTFDPLTGAKVTRIPGDRAADVTTFPDAGTKYIVYNNQVFDFAVTQNSKTYYGKVVIGDVTYADQTSETSRATLKVSVIFQPAAGVRDYIVNPQAD